MKWKVSKFRCDEHVILIAVQFINLSRAFQVQSRVGWLVGWVLWHINFSGIFNAKYCLSIYHDLVGWVLWHINLCRLFNAKSIFM